MVMSTTCQYEWVVPIDCWVAGPEEDRFSAVIKVRVFNNVMWETKATFFWSVFVTYRLTGREMSLKALTHFVHFWNKLLRKIIVIRVWRALRVGLIPRFYNIRRVRKLMFDDVFKVCKKLTLPLLILHPFMHFCRIKATIEPYEEMTMQLASISELFSAIISSYLAKDATSCAWLACHLVPTEEIMKEAIEREIKKLGTCDRIGCDTL